MLSLYHHLYPGACALKQHVGATQSVSGMCGLVGGVVGLDLVCRSPVFHTILLRSNFHRNEQREIVCHRSFPGGGAIRNPPASAEDVPDLGRSPKVGKGSPLQCSSWEIPWTEGHGGLQSVGSQGVGCDWATEHAHIQQGVICLNRLRMISLQQHGSVELPVITLSICQPLVTCG